MEPIPNQPEKNRRTARRHSARRTARIVCFANAMGLGPNLALSLLDVSESGARVTVKVPLPLHQEIEVNLSGISNRRPVKVIAEVVWCVPTTEEGTYQAGIRFQRYLSYQDLQELGS